MNKNPGVPRRKRYRILNELFFLLAIFIGRGSLADHYFVPSGSMEPTLAIGDHIAVDKTAYGIRVPLTRLRLTHRDPNRGDIIVFEHPETGTVLVKRVIGLPGDQLSFDGQNLSLNGQRVSQRLETGRRIEWMPEAIHPLHEDRNQGPPQPEIVVPQGQYFVMGDHRGNSSDSRYWGLVPEDRLLGRAMAILYSPRETLRFLEAWWIPLKADPRGFDRRLSFSSRGKEL